jgi:ABC-2 type transport system permease protein
VTVASRAAAVWQRREVLGLLIRRDLKVKYQQSILGYFWTLLEPLAFAGIYWFVFGVLFGSNRHAPKGGDYILFLVSGFLAWQWFNSNVAESTGALRKQAKLITTMKVPREVFPIGMVGAKIVEFLLSLPVLVVFFFVGHGHLSADILWFPVAMAMQIVLLTGVTLMLSSLNIVLRDVERIVRIILRAMFYLSPVIYTYELVMQKAPEAVKIIYQLNPMVGILQMYHSAFFPSEFPHTRLLVISVAGCLAILVFGWWIFKKLEPAVLKEL